MKRLPFRRCQWFMAIALLLGACGGHPLPDPLITSPAELEQAICPTSAQTFLAEARIEYYGNGEARKGKLTVMADPAGNLRLDVLSFTDDLIAVLAVKGGDFTWFERGRKPCFIGPLCAAPMVGQLPMLQQPGHLARVLAGDVPILLPEPATELSFSRQEGLYILVATQDNVKQTVKVKPDGRTVVEGSLAVDGKRILTIRYSGTIRAGERSLPQQVRILAPLDDVDLSLEYREVELGYVFRGDPFTFACPKGTEPEYLNCTKVLRHGK